MKTSITTNGKETRIVLVAENKLEQNIIDALDVFKADVKVSTYLNDKQEQELYLDIKHKNI